MNWREIYDRFSLSKKVKNGKKKRREAKHKKITFRRSKKVKRDGERWRFKFKTKTTQTQKRKEL